MTKFLGEGYTPHGNTHLRTIKKYSEETIKEGFKKAAENLLNTINVQILQPPVTAAIDITTWDHHAENDLPSEVSGTIGGERRAYKFATLSLIGKSMPIVLAYEPIIESSEWDENPEHHYHRTVRKLISRTQEFVTIDLVLADRGFESGKVYQTLDNANVNYLLPKIERSRELECIGWMEQENKEILAKTCSKDHELRIYYFVFGILMYNVWRLADVLLKVGVSKELTDYTPVITAGELADWIALHFQLEPD